MSAEDPTKPSKIVNLEEERQRRARGKAAKEAEAVGDSLNFDNPETPQVEAPDSSESPSSIRPGQGDYLDFSPASENSEPLTKEEEMIVLAEQLITDSHSGRKSMLESYAHAFEFDPDEQTDETERHFDKNLDAQREVFRNVSDSAEILPVLKEYAENPDSSRLPLIVAVAERFLEIIKSRGRAET